MVYRAGIGVPVLKMTASARAFQRCVARACIVTAYEVMALYSYGLNSYGLTIWLLGLPLADTTPCGRDIPVMPLVADIGHRRRAWSIARV